MQKYLTDIEKEFIKNLSKDPQETCASATKKFNEHFKDNRSRNSLKHQWALCRFSGNKKQQIDPVEKVQSERKLNSYKQNERDLVMQLEIATKKAEVAGWLSDHPVKTVPVIREQNKNKSEATAIAMASDWHFEETIEPESVQFLNEYNLDIAEKRAKNFFKNTLRLIEIFSRDTSIKNLVLFLGGDFISGYIHDELVEGNSLSPVQAILRVRNVLKSGIDFLLSNTKIKLTVPCCFGNHGRTTKKMMISTGYKNSYEWLLYHFLSNEYSSRKDRIEFIIPNGYMIYLPIYKFMNRFHHGEAIKYGGGVGGITIPVNKAIGQWNKMKWADYDFFGHFHQSIGQRNFECNGSAVGFNPFAIAIKAEYEPPQQKFILIDKDYGKTITAPIFLDR